MISFIIFGTRGVTYSAAKGTFHCPSCDDTREYNHKRVRRFFTLYFIPLIPLDKLGEYVECQTCKNTYELSVLDYNPQAAAAAFQADWERAVRRTMVQMMLADGNIEAKELAALKETYQNIATRGITQQELDDEIAAVRTDGKDVTTYLSEIAGSLNDHGKEMVVRAALAVAAADGKFQDEEIKLLNSIGEALQMTPAHLRGLFSEATGMPGSN